MPEFEYFLSDEAEKYCFYKIPKELFTNSFFDELSTQAKLMYGLMLDRVGLSRKNGWIDEQGRVYIIFTIEEMQNLTHWTKFRVTEILNELDSTDNGFGLIERRRRGMGRPNIIYVKNFTSRFPVYGNQDFRHAEIKKSDIRKSRLPICGNQDVRYSDGNNTNTSNNDMNNNNLSKTQVYGSLLGEFQNVRLTEEEQKKLKEQYPEEWKNMIENLSAYMVSTGKTYCNHYATMLSWKQKEEKEQKRDKKVRSYDCPEGEYL